MARFPTLIKIANGDSPYREKHPTYISPAPFVFGVWGLIHFLLGGFVIYQFFSSNQELVEDGIHWHFVGISLLNTLWLALWQGDHLILAWITILFTSSQVSYVYYTIKYNYPGGSFKEKIFIHAPFSLYHAWIFVITVISTFAAFLPDKDEDDASILVKTLVVFGLFVLSSTSVGYIEGAKGDITGAVVIAWTLYGIFVAQADPVIHWAALVFAVCTSFYILKPIVLKYYRGESDENAPLLS
ncbi:10552_t:CDS:2 [Funneliformis geosporum]|uniref:12379_t:CDS:1 n=1 Tax=Funneliformis geosporum TaxID=1117311 RepID=A0A9W4SJV6_9GLOM|nr:12379_t:CDS:2 [Funneliformis geosporum]CAI2176495.1 10552_t:CDS:2 [Funneliformis geosporum]